MNIIITGTSRGIGYELVKYFASLDQVNIYAISRNQQSFNVKTGNSSFIIPVAFDIATISRNADSLLEKFSDDFHVDILINNAGFLVNKPFVQISSREIQEMLNINCVAPAFMIKTLMPFMGKLHGTHVVNISSMGGFQGSVKFPGLSWYSAAKSALACLTECLETENEDKNIVFNCLALGAVQTEMLNEAFPGYKAPLNAAEMAEFIGQFALTAGKVMRGKIIPVTLSTP